MSRSNKAALSGAAQAWAEGVPLLEALEKYSAEDRWTRYVVLRDELGPYVPDEPIVMPAPPPAASNVSDSPFGRLAERYVLQCEIMDEVQALLSAEHLFGIGYRAPKRRDVEPIWIAASDWTGGTIGWTTSSLSNDAVTYVEVRVIASPEARDAELAVAAQRKTEARSHTLARRIRDAYDELRRENKINFKSLRVNRPAIEKAVARMLDPRRLNAEIRGVGYEAVRAAIGEQFKKDRATYMQQKRIIETQPKLLSDR